MVQGRASRPLFERWRPSRDHRIKVVAHEGAGRVSKALSVGQWRISAGKVSSGPHLRYRRRAPCFPIDIHEDIGGAKGGWSESAEEAETIKIVTGDDGGEGVG